RGDLPVVAALLCMYQVVCVRLVLRQERAVQVAAVGVPVAAAFGAVLPVVPPADAHAAQWPSPRTEIGPAAMVLETHHLAELVAVDHDVADEALVPGDGPGVEQADPRQLRPVVRPVETTEELVPAADGQQRHAGLDLGPQHLTLRPADIGGDGNLLPVLPAAPEEEVVAAGLQRLVHAERDHLGLDTPPAAALRQRQHIAAVAVDVHGAAVEPADGELHICSVGRSAYRVLRVAYSVFRVAFETRCCCLRLAPYAIRITEHGTRNTQHTSLLPERLHHAACRKELAQPQHGGVGRQDEAGAVRREVVHEGV